jgi:hypothetical protein
MNFCITSCEAVGPEKRSPDLLPDTKSYTGTVPNLDPDPGEPKRSPKM